MEIDILTLFPRMFAPIEESMIGRARKEGVISVRIWDIRDYATDRHRTVDDTPFGGGHGMVLKPEPVFEAVRDVRKRSETPVGRIVLLSPQGETFSHAKARELAAEKRLILICGHYEGFDERIRMAIPTDEISIGDYVLTGGELPAMVVTDAVSRLVPGVLGHEDGAVDDSFATGLLEYPHYTRPREYMGLAVPDVLLSGHHREIEKWRRRESLRRTFERRPDLLANEHLTDEDRLFLEEIRNSSDVT